MIPERSHATSLLIDFLSKAKPGEEFTKATLFIAAGSPNKALAPFLISARKYVQRHRGIVFGSIRGVGIRRMTDDECAEDQLHGLSHSARTAKKYRSRAACVTDRERITPRAKAILAVAEPIWAKLADDVKTEKIRQTIEIARIDGSANIVSIIQASKEGSR